MFVMYIPFYCIICIKEAILSIGNVLLQKVDYCVLIYCFIYLHLLSLI